MGIKISLFQHFLSYKWKIKHQTEELCFQLKVFYPLLTQDTTRTCNLFHQTHRESRLRDKTAQQYYCQHQNI